jgi:hypothetical protein
VYSDNKKRNHYYSTAERLSNKLAAHGIIGPRLFFTYNLPNKFTPAQFESELIIGDAARRASDKFEGIQIAPQTQKQIATKNAEYNIKLGQYSDFIRANNPDLNKIQTKDIREEIALLFGASYGFGPKEIQYFIDTAYRGMPAADQNADYDKIQQTIDFKWAGYKLHPDNIKEILIAIENKNRNDKALEYMAWRDSKGMEE